MFHGVELEGWGPNFKRIACDLYSDMAYIQKFMVVLFLVGMYIMGINKFIWHNMCNTRDCTWESKFMVSLDVMLP